MGAGGVCKPVFCPSWTVEKKLRGEEENIPNINHQKMKGF
jgi:hypothetical protein